MSYLVFARKYRPQSFGEVSGQEPVVRTLQNAIRTGRIAHAFLFAGPRGVGKTTIARLLARALNCEKGPTDEPCGSCASCRETAEGHSMDVLEIDGASNRGIDDVKSLRESIQYNPARDRFKVILIDEVHMLSTPAFNALLKTLEEPPPHAKFIFATTELHKVPATILSRCQVHEFRRIPFRETMDRLREILSREKITATEGALALIARHADGCLRDAQSALDQAVAFGGDAIDEEGVRQVLGLVASDLLFETMDAVLAGDSARLLTLVDRLSDSGTNVRAFLNRLAEHVRNLLVARIASDPGPLIPLAEAELARLVEQARHISEEEALRLLNLLALAEEDLKKTTAARFTLERTLLKLVQARRLAALPDLIAAVTGAAAGPAIAAETSMPSRPAPAPSPAAAPPPPRPPASAPAPPPAAAPLATRPPAPAPAPPPAAAPLPTRPPAAAPASSAPAPASPIRSSTPGAASAGAPPSDTPKPEPATPPAAAEPKAARDPRRKEAARARAEKDPTVGKLRDLFKAEMVDADEPS